MINPARRYETEIGGCLPGYVQHFGVGAGWRRKPARFVWQSRSRYRRIFRQGTKSGARQQRPDQEHAGPTANDQFRRGKGHKQIVAARRVLFVLPPSPDHRPVGSTADNRATPYDAIRRLNRNRLDAARVDRKAVMIRCRVEITVESTEVGEVGTAARKRVRTSARRCCARHANERDKK
jgi:hypothetical protein